MTLVLEDANGKRVRNLISETPFPEEQNTAWWDGLDDLGRNPEAARRGFMMCRGSSLGRVFIGRVAWCGLNLRRAG